MSMPGETELFVLVLLGSVGFGAVAYGHRTTRWKPMGIGIVLLTYPYFCESALMVYAIGLVLCASLFVFRD